MEITETETEGIAPETPLINENDEGAAETSDSRQQHEVLDISSFEREYAERGALSEESYKAFENIGIGKNVVDMYIEGRKAIAQAHADEIMNAAGGRAEYEKMTAWASENFSEAEKTAFNSAINSGDIQAARLAATGLNARYKLSAGYLPANRLEGGTGAGADIYASMAEMVRDVQDPRYKSDEAFRRKVAAKAAVSF